MITKKVAVAGVAALACIALVGACTPKAAGPQAQTKSATETLTEAAAKTKGQSYTYTLAYGDMLAGDGAQSGDGTSTSVNMTVTDKASGVTIKIAALVLGSDMYMKIDFGTLGANIPGLGQLGDKWMHLDASKISSGAFGLKPGTDTVGVSNYIKGIVSAEKVSDTEFTGKIDLSKSAPPGTSSDDIAKITGDKTVPFTATLDDQGRISKIVIKMPAVGQFPASDLTTTFSDFGSPVAVAKPAEAQIVEAPEMIYQFLQ